MEAFARSEKRAFDNRSAKVRIAVLSRIERTDDDVGARLKRQLVHNELTEFGGLGVQSKGPVKLDGSTVSNRKRPEGVDRLIGRLHLQHGTVAKNRVRTCHVESIVFGRRARPYGKANVRQIQNALKGFRPTSGESERFAGIRSDHAEGTLARHRIVDRPVASDRL